jgi:hypothetical protein
MWRGVAEQNMIAQPTKSKKMLKTVFLNVGWKVQRIFKTLKTYVF